MKLVILIIFILNILLFVNAAKLLVFSFSGSKSHMISQGRVADALVLDGHDVTFLSVDAVIPTKDFQTTKFAKEIIIGRIPEERKKFWQQSKASYMEALFKDPGLFDSYTSISPFVQSIDMIMEVALTEDKETIEKLKAEKFDAIFVEQLFPHGNALGHLLGIKIQFIIHSCPLMEHFTSLFGIPNPTGWVPSIGSLSISDKMTFFDRARNELEHHLLNAGYSQLFHGATNLFRKIYGSSFPDVRDILKENAPLIFVSVNEFIEFPRPIFHNIIYFGGLGMNGVKNESLQEPFENEMTKGKNGVIFFSLGSNVDSTNLPQIVKKNLIDAFADFHDYHFIVKLEATDAVGIEYAKTKSNIYVTHWAPQSILLQHPRLKLFFTHGGYNSLLEVALSGKPVLLMPMMYDQTRNGQIVERNGWGKVLNKMELLNGKNELVHTLKEILTNTKYLNGAQRIKHLLETKPFSAHEIFVKNVQFVLDNGGKLPELKPASMNMNLITQNNLDVYAFIFAILALLVAFIFTFVAYCIRLKTSFVSINPPPNVKKIN